MLDVLIIGCGPIGLYGANICRLHSLNGVVIESSTVIGGQLTQLYPEKNIIDLPGFSSISAKNFIDKLLKQHDSLENPLPIHLNEKVISFTKKADYYLVETDKSNYETKTIIITTGMGTFSPRLIGLENESKLKHILYSCNDLSLFKDKNVCLLGGGDSAVDLALMIKPLSKSTSIIHRRDDFRAQSSSVEEMKKIGVNIFPNKKILGIEQEDNDMLNINFEDNKTLNKENLLVDYVIVQYGQIPGKDNLPIEKENNQIKVGDYYQTSLENIFACGNCINYPGKVKNITSGLGEIVTIVTKIDQIINPTKNIPIHF